VSHGESYPSLTRNWLRWDFWFRSELALWSTWLWKWQVFWMPEGRIGLSCVLFKKIRWHLLCQWHGGFRGEEEVTNYSLERTLWGKGQHHREPLQPWSGPEAAVKNLWPWWWTTLAEMVTKGSCFVVTLSASVAQHGQQQHLFWEKRGPTVSLKGSSWILYTLEDQSCR